jgi:hypothetical protein
VLGDVCFAKALFISFGDGAFCLWAEIESRIYPAYGVAVSYYKIFVFKDLIFLRIAQKIAVVLKVDIERLKCSLFALGFKTVERLALFGWGCVWAKRLALLL